MKNNNVLDDLALDEQEQEKQDQFARIANSQAGKSNTQFKPLAPSYLSTEQASDWESRGFFILRGLASSDSCELVNQCAIDLVRDIAKSAPEKSREESNIKFGAISLAEKNFSTEVREAEDRASKLYNLHRRDVFRQWARNPTLTKCLGGILGPDVDVFNSQFIFKNPGAWGQPWHQDSLYFDFDKSPQVGVWLATSKATIENGCLFVAPGSHTEAIHEHLPDSRPAANVGYLEIRDFDFSNEECVEMEVGDVLVFHSFLMHKSVDNNSDTRRTALVYHYTQAQTRINGKIKSPTIDWMEILRNHQAIDGEKSHPVRERFNAIKLSFLYSLLKIVMALRKKK